MEPIFVRIPARPEFISILRLTASSLASSMDFDIEAIEDIRVCVSEACNNAILLGDNIEVSFYPHDDQLEIEVSPFGSPDNAVHEMGVLIMRSLMDVVEEKEDGIRMQKVKGSL